MSTDGVVMGLAETRETSLLIESTDSINVTIVDTNTTNSTCSTSTKDKYFSITESHWSWISRANQPESLVLDEVSPEGKSGKSRWHGTSGYPGATLLYHIAGNIGEVF